MVVQVLALAVSEITTSAEPLPVSEPRARVTTCSCPYTLPLTTCLVLQNIAFVDACFVVKEGLRLNIMYIVPTREYVHYF